MPAEPDGPTEQSEPPKGPGSQAGVAWAQANPERAMHLYREMLRIRRFEEKAGQLYGMGYIAGFCHLCIGQEAVAVGLSEARMAGDKTITAYRNHGHLLACGADITAVMAELCGRSGGLSAGKAGSVNLFWPDGGFYGGHGAVGSNVPIGAGLAFAAQYSGTDAVTWCVVGDQAMDQGQVHETFVIASRWALPIVFVIENNSGGDEADDESLLRRAEPFDIEGERVDGMDILSVMEAARRSREAVLSNKRPRLLECATSRYRGHSMAAPSKYSRAKGPTRSHAAASDPIARFGDTLLRAGVSEIDLRDVDRVLRDEINAATHFAQSDGEPSTDQLVADIRGKSRAGLTAYRRVHGEPSNTDQAGTDT